MRRVGSTLITNILTPDATMPRILSQDKVSFSRRKSSFSSYGSMTLKRQTPMREYSLTRMNKSSSTSLRQMVQSYSVCDHRTSGPPSPPSPPSSSRQNTEWNTEEHQGAVVSWSCLEQGTVSKPPSLSGSNTSAQTDRSSLSPTSYRSSLLEPTVPPAQVSAADARSGALRRFYALQKASMQEQQRPTTDRLRGPTAAGSVAYLPQDRIKRQENTWGQFVDVADAEEELVRRSKFLSIRRHLTTSSHSLPSQF